MGTTNLQILQQSVRLFFLEWQLLARILETCKLVKPTCPQCKSKNIARIFWGYPADMDEYLKGIESGELATGGCCVSGNDPKWECNDCANRWGHRKD